MIKRIINLIVLCLAFSIFWGVILTYVGTYLWTNIGVAIFVMDATGFLVFMVFLIVIGAGTTFLYAKILRRYFIFKFLVLAVITGAIEHELFYHMTFLPRKFYDHILAISKETLDLHPIIYFALGLITASIIVEIRKIVKAHGCPVHSCEKKLKRPVWHDHP